MNIYDKEIPFWARPLRRIYRVVKNFVFSPYPRLTQIRRGGIDYLVWTNEEIGQKLLLFRSHEKNELKVFAEYIKAGDICIDVGGNIGFYSLNFAKFCGPEGRVFVFEPVPRNVLVIKLAAIINGFKNIEVYEGVVSDSAGLQQLMLPRDSSYAFIGRDASSQKVDLINIESTTLDSFVSQAGIKKISVLKVDVEGAEYQVLLGANKLLGDAQLKPQLVMAELCSPYLNRFGSTIENVVLYMREFGYNPYVANSRGGMFEYSSDKADKIFNVFFILD
jgi:FkbM family methyltransferase